MEHDNANANQIQFNNDSHADSFTLCQENLPENKKYDKNIGFRIFYSKFIYRIDTKSSSLNAHTHDTNNFT